MRAMAGGRRSRCQPEADRQPEIEIAVRAPAGSPPAHLEIFGTSGADVSRVGASGLIA